MASSSRDRISIDLRGLKSALVERSQAVGLTPSGFVREVLAAALQAQVAASLSSRPPMPQPDGAQRVRLSLRVTTVQAGAIVRAARAAGMPLGEFVSGQVAGVPIVADGASRGELIAVVTATNAELASLSRNLHHLGMLLRQGAWRAADEYRPMLDTLLPDLRSHLEAAACALGELHPPRGSAVTATGNGRRP